MKTSRSRIKRVFRCSQLIPTSTTLTRYGASSGFIASSSFVSAAADLLIAAEENVERLWGLPPSWGRYSDGAHRVLYTAASPTVAVAERTHWAIEVIFRSSRSTISIAGFAVFSCKVIRSGKSYMRGWRLNKMLVHPSDYGLCQRIGSDERNLGTPYIVVPSARRRKGRCVPVFRRNVVTPERVLSTFAIEWDRPKDMAFRVVRGRRYDVKIDPVFSLC